MKRRLSGVLLAVLLAPCLRGEKGIPVRTPEVAVEAPPRFAGLAARIRGTFPARRREVEARLGAPLGGPVRIVVAADRSALERRLGVQLPPWAAGVALPEARRIGLVAAALRRGGGRELAVVLRHELAHLLLHDRLGGSARVPRWLEEGLCQWVAGRAYLGLREELMARLSFDELLPWSRLRTRFPRAPAEARLAYLQSFHFVAYLIRTRGLPFVWRVVEETARGRETAAVLLRATGKAQVDLEREWMAYERRRDLWYLFALEAFSPLVLAAGLAVLAYRRRRRRDETLRELLAAAEAEEERLPSEGT